jgi:hypothetical protein
MPWLGFPGPKRGKQGLGFFIMKGSTVLYTRHERANNCEVATVVVSREGVRSTVINTYWDATGAASADNVVTCGETVLLHLADTNHFDAPITFLAGDLNVDMLKDTALARAGGPS